MAEKEKKPVIRFRGFNDVWEQRKLEELISLGNGKDYKHLEKGVIPVYGTGGYMTSVDQYLCDKDSIGIGRKGTIDQPYILRAPFWTVDTLFFATPKDNIELDYLFGIFQTIDWKQKDESTGVPSLSKQNINTIEVFVSFDKSEQKSIGKHFSQLDNLITLHQRKLDKLKNVKKSMLEKMFPRDGAKVPEIRFAGFTDAWEQRKFSDIAETRRGLTYKPENITESEGIRVLRSSNINEDTFVFSSDDVFVEPTVVKIPLVKNGDILITSANGSSRLVGKHSIVRDLHDNSAVHGGFMLLASAKEPEFVNALMGATWYTKLINTFVAGGNGAIGNLNKSDLDNQIVLIPSIEEQKKIGQFFISLDNLITLHQRKLDKLKNIKKAVLEKMFV